MLDHSESSPLYKQLQEKILDSIHDGTLKPGDKLPTELELSETNQVSRVTVRAALDALTSEGYLVRIPGKGTFITKDKIQKNVAETIGFSDTCRLQNKTPGAKVIKCVIEEATAADQEHLGLNPGDKVINIERIRYADNVPISVEYSRFPSSYSFLLQEDLNDKSLYEILRSKYKVTFGHSRKYIVMEYASFDVAAYLNIEEGYPLLSIRSTVSSPDGQKIHRSKQLILGDKFELIV
ncbi:GntR family transcriptional regulator [Paenibacillus sonchi]|uniref:GntR family transcriptional regulator n=3 Tax=Paenibacillus sonchi group TaxID=2044880 RepID=A0A974PCK2_9BACL|nr:MULTISPECIES: GntR family transcriptional regulator [Paenibacillus sonchi group]KWX76156.1 GntR family transcriptional regulator [Paenibacillus riograndensis]MCE3202295.1 GntR family transcriptional regulator [Paenibacillus sonchi]QQZ61011.1 GntR family transcriptional regulator [Paenibacillus sonchi]CQR57295.1 GntR family transcriptional regulator [Paenibacillus riograndensis SBR5]